MWKKKPSFSPSCSWSSTHTPLSHFLFSRLQNVFFLLEFLGRTEVPVATIKKELENKGPVTRRLLLHEVPTGEVWVRLDLQLFANK